jgi:hypothetical protein
LTGIQAIGQAYQVRLVACNEQHALTALPGKKSSGDRLMTVPRGGRGLRPRSPDQAAILPGDPGLPRLTRQGNIRAGQRGARSD